MTDRAATLGQLRASGWISRPVKEEIRANAVAKISAGEALFDGVVGYENTVMPQLENALLAGHDVIFLGERGQAKTRMIRSLTGLLDEWMPIVAGSEINDDPYAPVSRHAKDLIDEMGDDTPIGWVHRDARFGEKLATPDTSISDLIGEVDPIKVAEGRYLSDELTLHYGLVPRTNRGVFAINELPDLAERIQVGMLNVLEERDVQIRGYKIRLPLDVMLVASANPEDYTNRGRIITPLKDRFGSQIRTHYPLDAELEYEIMKQEARPLSVGERRGSGARIPRRGRGDLQPVGSVEQSCQPAQRRQCPPLRVELRGAGRQRSTGAACGPASGRSSPVSTTSMRLLASSIGKIEIEALEDGREGVIFDNLVRGAVLTVFKDRVDPSHTTPIVDAFEEGLVVHTGEDMTSDQLAGLVVEVPALRAPVDATDSGRFVAGGDCGGGRIRVGGPAPLEAPQQGRLGHQRHLPRPALTRRRYRREARVR